LTAADKLIGQPCIRGRTGILEQAPTVAECAESAADPPEFPTPGVPMHVSPTKANQQAQPRATAYQQGHERERGAWRLRAHDTQCSCSAIVDEASGRRS
jgi:hypothetical protein